MQQLAGRLVQQVALVRRLLEHLQNRPAPTMLDQVLRLLQVEQVLPELRQADQVLQQLQKVPVALEHILDQQGVQRRVRLIHVHHRLITEQVVPQEVQLIQDHRQQGAQPVVQIIDQPQHKPVDLLAVVALVKGLIPVLRDLHRAVPVQEVLGRQRKVQVLHQAADLVQAQVQVLLEEDNLFNHLN